MAEKLPKTARPPARNAPSVAIGIARHRSLRRDARMAAPASLAEQIVLEYLAAADPLPAEPAEVVLGLGHFDREIPRHCAALAREGRARWIVFSGGVGAGSGDFSQAEALEFRDQLAREEPDLAPRLAAVETRSTNTGENLEFTTALLAATRPDLRPGEGLRRVLVVTTPCRLRRALATVAKHWPGVAVHGAPPAWTFAGEVEKYRAQGQELRPQLVGEVERLVGYPKKGFIAPVTVPPEILAAARQLGTKV